MLIPEDEMPEDENLTHILSEAEEPTFFWQNWKVEILAVLWLFRDISNIEWRRWWSRN